MGEGALLGGCRCPQKVTLSGCLTTAGAGTLGVMMAGGAAAKVVLLAAA
jgi:hypothetical protein